MLPTPSPSRTSESATAEHTGYEADSEEHSSDSWATPPPHTPTTTAPNSSMTQEWSAQRQPSTLNLTDNINFSPPVILGHHKQNKPTDDTILN